MIIFLRFGSLVVFITSEFLVLRLRGGTLFKRFSISLSCLVWHVFVLFRLLFKVFSGKSDQVGGVAPNDLLGEVLENFGQGGGHIYLLGREDSHFTYVSHFVSLCIVFILLSKVKCGVSM